jgi:hypothetical protein
MLVNIDGNSVYFRGGSTNDRLTLPSSSAFDLSSGTWTIEFWMYPTAMPTAGNQCRVLMFGSNGTSNSYDVGFNNDGSIGGIVPLGSPVGVYSPPGVISTNSWFHIAISSISGTATLYVNGISKAGPNVILQPTSGAIPLYIGYDTVGTVNFQYQGYLSNLRIVKGVGVYTNAFTTPSGTLTATQTSGTNISAIGTAVSTTSGTQLLMLQNSLLGDTSINNFTATATGAPTLNTNPLYSPSFVSVNGRSVFFTGSTQYINAPSNTVFTFGTGNFTIEGWIYLVTATNSGTLFDNRTGATTVSSQIYVASNVVYYAVAGVNVITGGSINVNTWYHIAVVKSSGSTKLYVNGAQSGSTYTDANNYVIGSPFIGTGFGSSNPLNGYITNLRVFNGTAVYTTTFTPSTTSLSSSLAGSGIVAITAPTTTNGYYATAHAQLTTQYLSLPGTPFVFGTNPFTVECWVYLSSFAANQVIIDNYVTGPSGSFTVGQWNFWCNTSGAITFTYATAAGVAFGITTTTFVTVNTWTHIAAVRSSTATNGFVIYINGVAGVTGTISATVGANATSSIGIQTFSKTFPTVGMISNVRITNLAVYTGAFTTPTGPLGATQSSGTNIAAITGTSVALLTCQSATIIDNSTFAVAITNFGTVPTLIAYGLFNNNTGVSLLTAQNASTAVTGSIILGGTATAQYQVALNGTSQYLSIANTTALDLPGDFTIECWFNTTNASANQTIVSKWNTSAYGWTTSVNTTAQTVSIGVGNSGTYVNGYGWNATINANIWYHLAFTRSGSTFRAFLNGTLLTGTYTDSSNLSATATTYIGRDDTLTRNFYGYISNLRIVKGVAVYTSTFSTPTTAVTAITNTVLLTCNSATFVDNSINAFTITPVNSPVISVGTLSLVQGGSVQSGTATVSDNSVNQLLLTNTGPVATAQIYGLFGTSLTGLLALHTNLINDSSVNNITLTQTGTVYLERSFSPLSANTVPSLLTNQSVVNNDSSISSATITNTTLNSTVAYQVTVNPYGNTAPTAILTAQSNVLSSDATGFNTSYITNTGTVIPVNTAHGPFNNDTPLLTLQNALVIDNSNNRGTMTSVGGGVSPTDSSPFTPSKSLTSLLIPYGYNDVSISNTYSTTSQLANSYVANNANTAITNTVFNPYVIPVNTVSVLALQTTNIYLESSIYSSILPLTTSGTVPTSNTSSPFGTYNGNGILILNTSSTTGIPGNTLNYANLVITSPDTTVTNTYSITITASSTSNIGNVINIDTGYNTRLANANILVVDVANSNISEPTLLTFANTSITPAVNRVDAGFSVAPSNTTFVITDVANSNLSESLNSIFVSNVNTTRFNVDTGVLNIRPSNITFIITDVANSNLAETLSNVFVSNVRTTREIVDTGTFPVPSPVGGTVLFPTYAYTDGVPISAANVQSGGGGSSTSSNQQIWYQT